MTQPPHWRAETKLLLDRAQLNEASRLLPEQFARASTALDAADALFRRRYAAEAETAYQQALAQARILDEQLAKEQLQRAREQQQRVEAAQLGVARQRAVWEEQRRLSWEEQLQASQEATAEASEEQEEPKRETVVKERLLASYTVKRGESLPQIASRPDVYGDNQLWPLLYRANRDQISDPRRIWPGQVLRIPRNITPDEMAEARRYAQRTAYF